MDEEVRFQAYGGRPARVREVCMLEFDDTGRTERIKVWDHPSTSAAKIKGHVATWKKKNCELMRYTGLKDRKGDEIYGSFLLKNGLGEVFEVMFKNGRWIDKDVNNGQEMDLYRDPTEDGRLWYKEIIGNIYENTELLR